MDRKELELKTKEQKVAQLTIQLNSIRTNKEYSALQHEIAGVKADASLLEDELLVILDETDKEEAARKEHETGLKQAEQDFARLQARSKEEDSLLDADLHKLHEQRQSTLNEVPGELRLLYERLLGTKDGQAVVRAMRADADNRVCSGCFMRLTSNTTNLLLGGGEVVRCYSCGRILYIDDGPEDQADLVGK